MTEQTHKDIQTELQRIARVSDMLCTAHAGLRDRYSHLSLLLDLSILFVSAWLVALAFVDPQLNLSLTPGSIAPKIWAGLLSCTVFALSIIQLRVDWKGKASTHASSLLAYSAIKREAAALHVSGDDLDEKACRALFTKYETAGLASLPEREFLAQKRRHLMKVQVSKHLDTHPGASLITTKLRIALRDSFKSVEKD